MPGEAVAVPGLRRTARPRPAELTAREERRLVRAAQRGDRDAVERLFRAHWPACHRAAVLITRDAAAAEDIAQEAFLAALGALERFDRRRPLGPWLRRIVANRAIDAARARAVRREVGPAALEVLFRRHWPRMHRLAFLVCHDAAAAEDIAQEAFLSAVRALDRFDRRRPFAPWLTRIVVNRAIDWTRSRTLRREDLSDMPLAVAAQAEPGLGEDVVDALRRLPPDQRAVVVLRHLLGYTPREIGRMLDLPTGTVNSRMRRGLNALEGDIE